MGSNEPIDRMSKKRRLEISYTPDFRAVGIFTAQKGYRLCWLLNRHLGVSFRRMPEFVHNPDKPSRQRKITVYSYTNPGQLIRYYLIPNKSGNAPLFESPNMDYLFLINAPSDQFEILPLIKTIRNIPQVSTAMEAGEVFDKASEGFFYDLELYLSGSGCNDKGG